MVNHDESKKILAFAVHMGEILLKSGAETYRVEDTLVRVLNASHFHKVDTFVIPTGIMISIGDESFSLRTSVSRIKDRSTRLDKIEHINQLSRDYVSGLIPLDEATLKLLEIDCLPAYPAWLGILAPGICCAGFVFMFNGSFPDFLLALGIGTTTAWIQWLLGKRKILSYFVLFLVAVFIGGVTMSAAQLLGDTLHTETIIISCIMPLLPGVAFTNAVRDTIGDELLSGMSRGIEALFIAITLAAGIAVAMSITRYLGGQI